MAIKLRNKRNTEFSSTSMADLVFLLLIFFILVSTIVSPNAIPLLLPNSSSPAPIETQNITVYIDEQYNYFIEDESNPVSVDQMSTAISQRLAGMQKANVVLRADQSVAVQHIVNVIDAVNTVNRETGNNFKVILATQPK
jgi:biopolymer transport protein ExbD